MRSSQQSPAAGRPADQHSGVVTCELVDACRGEVHARSISYENSFGKHVRGTLSVAVVFSELGRGLEVWLGLVILSRFKTILFHSKVDGVLGFVATLSAGTRPPQLLAGGGRADAICRA